MTSRSSFTLSALSILAVASLAAAEPAKSSETPQTSPKYAVETYRVRTDRLTVLVDSYPASQRMREDYIPLRVAVAFTGKGHPVRLDLDSFTLIDPMGRAVEMAQYEPFAKQYTKRTADASLFRARPMIVGSQFRSFSRVSSHFYPAPGRHTRTMTVELSPFTWMRDVIYFKRPAAEAGSLYTLRVSSLDLDAPVEIKFRIGEPPKIAPLG